MSKVSECLWVLLAHKHVFPTSPFLFFLPFCSGGEKARVWQTAFPWASRRKHDYVIIYFRKRDPFKRLLLCLFNLAWLGFCLVQQERQGDDRFGNESDRAPGEVLPQPQIHHCGKRCILYAALTAVPWRSVKVTLKSSYVSPEGNQKEESG